MQCVERILVGKARTFGKILKELCRLELVTSILAPGVPRWCEWVMLGINRPHRAQCGTGQRLDEIFNLRKREVFWRDRRRR